MLLSLDFIYSSRTSPIYLVGYLQYFQCFVVQLVMFLVLSFLSQLVPPCSVHLSLFSVWSGSVPCLSFSKPPFMLSQVSVCPLLECQSLSSHVASVSLFLESFPSVVSVSMSFPIFLCCILCTSFVLYSDHQPK